MDAIEAEKTNMLRRQRMPLMRGYAEAPKAPSVGTAMDSIGVRSSKRITHAHGEVLSGGGRSRREGVAAIDRGKAKAGTRLFTALDIAPHNADTPAEARYYLFFDPTVPPPATAPSPAWESYEFRKKLCEAVAAAIVNGPLSLNMATTQMASSYWSTASALLRGHSHRQYPHSSEWGTKEHHGASCPLLSRFVAFNVNSPHPVADFAPGPQWREHFPKRCFRLSPKATRNCLEHSCIFDFDPCASHNGRRLLYIKSSTPFSDGDDDYSLHKRTGVPTAIELDIEARDLLDGVYPSCSLSCLSALRFLADLCHYHSHRLNL